MNPQATDKPPLSRRGGAFTLIELLVVISIIVILLAVSIPTIRTLTKGNSQKQAVNLLTTMLANARATAISTHKASGIVIYEYPPPNIGTPTEAASYIQLVTQSSVTGGGKLRYFKRVPRSTPQRLPLGVQVATLDDSGAFKTETNSANTKCRAVMFDSNGQMVLVNALAMDTALATDPIAPYWYLNGAASASAGVSSPGFLIYDSALFTAAYTTAPANATTWLKQNADIIILNPYTGNVIR